MSKADEDLTDPNLVVPSPMAGPTVDEDVATRVAPATYGDGQPVPHPIDPTHSASKGGPDAAIGRARRQAEAVNDAWADYDEAGDAWSQTSVGEPDQRPISAVSPVLVVPPVVAPAVGFLLPADGGAPIPLTARSLKVGRTEDCEVCLLAPSVSRLHAHLHFEAGQFVLEDAKSANGSFVDDQRVARATLADGATVRFGEVRLKVHLGALVPQVDGAGRRPAGAAPTGAAATGPVVAVPAAAPPAAAARAPGGRPPPPEAARVARGGRPPGAASSSGSRGGSGRPIWPPLLVGVLALGLVLLGSLALQRRVHQSDLFALFQDGVTAFRAHSWDEAETAFLALLQANPNHPHTRTYLAALEREREAQRLLLEAREARKNDELGRAQSTASQLLSTAYRGEAQALLHEIDAEVESRSGLAATAFRADQVPVAVKLVQSLDGVDVDRPDLEALRLTARLRQTPPPAPRPSPSATPRPATLSALVGNSPLATARRLFAAGRFGDALRLLDPLGDDAAERLRHELERFNDAYEGGLGEHRHKRAGAALTLLGEARSLASTIAGPETEVMATINHKMADMRYILGMQALLANSLPEAYQGFHGALLLTSEHVLARRQLLALADRAEQLYSQAVQRQGEDAEGARRELRLVLEIVPPENAFYRRAKVRLDGLP